MINFLIGKITNLNNNNITLLTSGGVGYAVCCTNSLLHNYQSGDTIEALIHTQVREDDISLFGFKNKEEKAWFNKLLAVQGVGAKMAILILNSLTIDEIVTGISTKEHSIFQKISGIGPKLAKRLTIEINLKDMPAIVINNTSATIANPSLLQDATDALTALGFNKHEVTKALANSDTANSNTVEDLIKFGLSQLTRG